MEWASPAGSPGRSVMTTALRERRGAQTPAAERTHKVESAAARSDSPVVCDLEWM